MQFTMKHLKNMIEFCTTCYHSKSSIDCWGPKELKFDYQFIHFKLNFHLKEFH